MTRTRLLLLVVLIIGAVVYALPSIAERELNQVKRPAHAPSAHARKLHASLRIVDLHADSLMATRDLGSRSSSGHVDLPRLLEGNVAVQAFTIVTKVPRGLNMTRNDDKSDLVRLIAIGARWPMRTWGSLLERALYQAGKLEALAARPQARLEVLRARADLKGFLDRRANGPPRVAGLLGIEGAHALEGKLENVERLYEAGVRMIAPVHFFDNEWAGSAHGVHKGGLTDAGRALVAALEERKILVDLAHASPATIEDVLRIAARPVVVSHTGVAGTCPGPRNLSDAQLRAIAARGGLIGIGYFKAAACGEDPSFIARAIAHAVSVAGPEHVALGSDFDGAVTTPFDAAELVYLTDALLAAGMHEKTIRLVMGENALRFLSAQLP